MWWKLITRQILAAGTSSAKLSRYISPSIQLSEHLQSDVTVHHMCCSPMTLSVKEQSHCGVALGQKKKIKALLSFLLGGLSPLSS